MYSLLGLNSIDRVRRDGPSQAVVGQIHVNSRPNTTGEPLALAA